MGVSAEELLARVQEVAGAAGGPTHQHCGQPTIVVAREQALPFFRALRDEPELAFDLLADLTAVDYLGREPRFEVVVHLYSIARGHRLRVKVPVPGEDPWVHSLTGLWKAANWLERELWDMFGIRSVGHPDLRRILMYEEFVGHPLRKDYPVGKRQPLTEERDPIARGWKF
jgi:NADH-quinone oxidoreductase subunit C